MVTNVLFLVQWLKETFLPYLENWERQVQARRQFTAAEKKRMILSEETLLGLRMTGIVHNVLHVVFHFVSLSA